MSAPLADLMERYCHGDRVAFDQFYQEVGARILSYLLKLCGDRATAEDLLQVTFLKVHRARSSYVAGADPLPWLYSIAHRSFLDEFRRKKRTRVTLTSLGDNVPDISVNQVGVRTSDWDDGPDRHLAEAALTALAKLPEKQRQAVTLVKLSGKSLAEAATIAGTSTGAMKVRAHRGYEALRRAFATELADGRKLPSPSHGKTKIA